LNLIYSILILIFEHFPDLRDWNFDTALHTPSGPRSDLGVTDFPQALHPEPNGILGLMLGSPSWNLHIGIIFYGILTAFLKLEKIEI
jgi:hypothetical protein